MIDYTDIDARLDEYSEAFDFYMERGEMPPSMPESDCLAGYMQEVIDSNPQIDGSDPVWVEVLKEHLISFFTAMLEQFRDMQLEAMKELAMIARFREASIERKRTMWQQIGDTIRAGYSEYEVNLAGYTAQFKTDDRDAVFSALTGDWESACKNKLEQEERRILERSKTRFEIFCKEAATRDYEDKKKIDGYIHRYPQLKDIVDKIGRDKDSSKEEMDAVIYRFMPVTVAKNSSAEDIDRVETGDNLERVLPVEFSMPEDMFYKRYAVKELQQFGSPGKDKPRKVVEPRKDPRLVKGPIVVSIDTSESMSGRPERIAFSLLKQLLRMARRQKRPCFLMSFSVRAKSIDLAKPRNWGKLGAFLTNSFSGGTDGELMLAQAVDVLQNGTFEMADVLIISDLVFPTPRPETVAKIETQKSLGTRFYALQIGRDSHQYDKILDRIWQV